MANKDTFQFQPRDHNHRLLPARNATPVSFEGFEEVSFCLYKMDGLWAIAEVSTALPVVRGMDSKHHAQDKATTLLNTMGLGKTQKAITFQLERIATL